MVSSTVNNSSLLPPSPFASSDDRNISLRSSNPFRTIDRMLADGDDRVIFCCASRPGYLGAVQSKQDNKDTAKWHPYPTVTGCWKSAVYWPTSSFVYCRSEKFSALDMVTLCLYIEILDRRAGQNGWRKIEGVDYQGLSVTKFCRWLRVRRSR